MTSQTNIEMTLTVSTTGEPISGLIDDGGGGQKPCTGWLELISAVETVRRGTGQDTAEETRK